MSSDKEQIREFVKSLGDDFHDRIKALASDANYRPGPREWPDDPDPFGMDWKWLRPHPSVVSRSEKVTPRIDWKRVGINLALAATLLLCGGIFHRVFLENPTGAREILVAQAGTTRVAERDPNKQVPAIEITSPISGFATVVSLASGRRPLVLPALGGGDYPISADERSAPIPLPDDTSDVVFVVTETPSGEQVRRIEDELRDLGPNDKDEIRERIGQVLEEKGYRRMAFGEVSFDRQN